MRNKKQTKKRFSVVSLFSGCGGLDLGFKKTGFDILWANDIDKDSVATYKKNIDDVIILGDIKKLNKENVPKNADVLLGGFPCQGFSIANNNRNIKDERNFLYKEMLETIVTSRPKFFVAENVKGILSLGGGKVIDMIIKDFKSIGYSVEKPFLINCAYYGVPQFRERVFIIGNRIGAPNPFPLITHVNGIETPIPEFLKPNFKKLPKVISVREAIGNMPDPDSPEGKKIPNHYGSNNVKGHYMARKNDVDQFKICDYLKNWKKRAGISTENIDKMLGHKYTAGHWFRKDNNSGSIPKLEDWWKLKEILDFDDKYDKAVTEFEKRDIKFEQTLRITNWDRPSDTITASGPEIHVNKKRRLTVRECARLQSFPDNFILTGSISSQYGQVGNAVPPLMAKKIALEIKKQLKSNQL
jgi:DNA (cytosine-5)-methyltransferase 1